MTIFRWTDRSEAGEVLHPYHGTVCVPLTANHEVSMVRYNGANDDFKYVMMRFDPATDSSGFFGTTAHGLPLIGGTCWMSIELVKGDFIWWFAYPYVDNEGFNGSTDSHAALSTQFSNKPSGTTKAGPTYVRFADEDLATGDILVWDISGGGNMLVEADESAVAAQEAYGVLELQCDQDWNPLTQSMSLYLHLDFWSGNITTSRKVNANLQLGDEVSSSFNGLDFHEYADSGGNSIFLYFGHPGLAYYG